MLPNNLFLLDPGALKFLLLLPVIVVLYMVRSRYRRRRISSIMLWRSIHRDLEARQRVRLPPLSLLMLLQLLAIALGAFALAQPALPAQDGTHLVLLLDVSTSMQATDVEPSRFDVALDRARQAILQLQPGDQVSVVAVGKSPVLAASTADTTEALAAIDHLAPGADSANVDAALKVAESLVRDSGGRGDALLLSDGAFGDAYHPREVNVPVEFQPIGVSGDNQGITALEVKPDLDGSGRWSAFARVTNYADRQVEIPATATADGLLLDRHQVKLGPRGTSDLAFALPPGTKNFALSLNGSDGYPADDGAQTRVDVPIQRNVLLVSKNPAPIEKVLQTLPGLKLTTVAPEGYDSAAAADLVVLDGFVPATLPNADLLIMNPPMDAPGFGVQPGGGETSVLRSNRDSPLIDSVDLQSLRLGQSVRMETPTWAHGVVEGQSGPLLLEGYRDGRRVVIFNFDWSMFDLPRMQAFPLLLSNAVSELSAVSLPRSIHPGESVLLRPVADASQATIDMPDGSHRDVSLSSGARSFAETQEVGRYTVRWKGPRVGDVASSFAVSVTSESQSNIVPRAYSFGLAPLPAPPSKPVAGRQLWPALALGLLGLLMGEWVYFARRN